MWHLETMDGFDTEARPCRLPGEFATETEALSAADMHLARIERAQPSATAGSAGGEADIQDRLWLVAPDGNRRRLFPGTAEAPRHAPQPSAAPAAVPLMCFRCITGTCGHADPLGSAHGGGLVLAVTIAGGTALCLDCAVKSADGH